MDLGGVWRVAPGSEERRQTFHEFDCVDSDWIDMEVPSHWAQGVSGRPSALAGEEAVLYRRRFETPKQTGGPTSTLHGAADRGGVAHPPASEDAGDDDGKARRRWWLRFEGIAEQGDIWLDGKYLGHTDGYFVPHEFEVTDDLSARSEHLLAIDATCRRFGDPDNRSTLTGALQDPELCGVDDLIVGGVWRPVRLRDTGAIAIRHCRAVCAEVRTVGGRRDQPGGVSARLRMRAVLDVPGGGAVELATGVAGTHHVHVHHAAGGENRLEWNVEVDDPPLWWPHALGDQPLCDLTLEATRDGEVHDSKQLRIGFRSVEMRRWVLHVNGERLFIKGANLLPVHRLLGAASSSEVRADVRAARNAGLDMVRPIAHIARPELYDAADELGVLVWQDLPVRGVMSRSVAAQARRQAREAVDLLGHHPSVAVWCAHDEPFSRTRRPSATPPAVSRLGPSWNRDMLDRRLSRVLSRCDGSRPVVAHTAVPPHFPQVDGTTSQLWFGLHGGRAADLAKTLARVPAIGRFVSAFGTPVEPDQPEVIKTTIEILRRLKYRPTGGFLLHALADPGPVAPTEARQSDNTRSDDDPGPDSSTEVDTHADRAISREPDTDKRAHTNVRGDANPNTTNDKLAHPKSGFGVLDSARRPKPGWQALVDACRPLIAVIDPLPASVQAGETIETRVHIVNDNRVAYDELEVRAAVTGRDGEVLSEQRWRGSVDADACVSVGRITISVPQTDGGTSRSTRRRSASASARPARDLPSAGAAVLTVDVELRREAEATVASGTGETRVNRYRTTIL